MQWNLTFKTTWQIGTVWGLMTAVLACRPVQYEAMDQGNRTISKFRRVFTVPLVFLITTFQCTSEVNVALHWQACLIGIRCKRFYTDFTGAASTTISSNTSCIFYNIQLSQIAHLFRSECLYNRQHRNRCNPQCHQHRFRDIDRESWYIH